MKVNAVLCLALALCLVLAIDAKALKGKKKSKQPKAKDVTESGEARGESAVDTVEAAAAAGAAAGGKGKETKLAAPAPVAPAPPADTGSAEGSDINAVGEDDESEDVGQATKNAGMEKIDSDQEKPLMIGQVPNKEEKLMEPSSEKEDEPLVIGRAPIIMGGHPHPGPPSAINPNPEPRYCPGNCDQNCAPACMEFCCEKSVQLPRPDAPGMSPSPYQLQNAVPEPLSYGQTPVVNAQQPCGSICKKHKIAHDPMKSQGKNSKKNSVNSKSKKGKH